MRPTPVLLAASSSSADASAFARMRSSAPKDARRLRWTTGTSAGGARTRLLPPGKAGHGPCTRAGSRASSMTRRHHRIKTHDHWDVRQPWQGIYLWRDPYGTHYLVDHTGTRRLNAA